MYFWRIYHKDEINTMFMEVACCGWEQRHKLSRFEPLWKCKICCIVLTFVKSLKHKQRLGMYIVEHKQHTLSKTQQQLFQQNAAVANQTDVKSAHRRQHW